MIPVTLVSGVLGAGKSTWLARHLAAAEGAPRVIVNDLADSMPDDDTFAGASPELIVGGCICCDAAAALVAHLRDLCADVHAGSIVDAVVIEMSGVADPAAVVELIRTDGVLTHNLVVDDVIVVVDGLLGVREMRHDPLAARQLQAADRLVISKTDLVTQQEAEQAVAMLRALSPTADLDLVPRSHGIDPRAVLPVPFETPGHDAADVRPVHAVTVPVEPDVEWPVLATWIGALLSAHGEQVLRLKGAIPTPVGSLVLNAVRGTMHAPRRRQEPLTHPVLTLVVQGLSPDDVVASWRRFRDTSTSVRPRSEVLS